MRVLRLAVLLSFGIAIASPVRSDDAKPPAGFVALFNGKDLTGWKATGNPKVWGVEKGVIYVEKGGGGWLLTEKEFGDFDLRLEYKMSKGANSGVALRTPTKGDPAYVGMEIQLIDDEGWPGKLADYQHTGSIYDVVPSSSRNNKPIGQWNKMHIVCKGSFVKVEVNGKTVVDANLEDSKEKKSAAPSRHLAGQRARRLSKLQHPRRVPQRVHQAALKANGRQAPRAERRLIRLGSADLPDAQKARAAVIRTSNLVNTSCNRC